jgi:hypothetical protein
MYTSVLVILKGSTEDITNFVNLGTIERGSAAKVSCSRWDCDERSTKGSSRGRS